MNNELLLHRNENCRRLEFHYYSELEKDYS